jgi:hypothetical protein
MTHPFDRLLREFFTDEYRHHPQRDGIVLAHILKELRAMALDLTKFNAALAASIAATEALISAHTDPTAQTAVDGAADVLNTETAKAVAAVATVAPAAPAA